MSDGGAIYTLSRQPGTLVAENYIHDIERNEWHGLWPLPAIFLDNGSNFITVRDNVGINVEGGVVRQNDNGPDNFFFNNNGTSPSVIANAGLELPYQDIIHPKADIVDIAPDPRQSAVGIAVIQFSEFVTGVDLADFRLTRDGAAISLAGSALIQGGMNYTLNLGSVTNLPGNYELRLVGLGSGIVNRAGNVLAADVVDMWATSTGSIPGDYDRSGVVDYGDHARWRSAFGSQTDPAADGNGNGIVDAADYVVWRKNLSAQAASLPIMAASEDAVESGIAGVSSSGMNGQFPVLKWDMTNETAGPRNTAAIHNSKTHELMTEEASFSKAELIAALQSMSIRGHDAAELNSSTSEKTGLISVNSSQALDGSLEMLFSELGQTSFNNTFAIAWS
jgi:hypothetical protein